MEIAGDVSIECPTSGYSLKLSFKNKGYFKVRTHPGVGLRANLKSISHGCHLSEVAFVWELTKETIHLPMGCLQGGRVGLLTARYALISHNVLMKLF